MRPGFGRAPAPASGAWSEPAAPDRTPRRRGPPAPSPIPEAARDLLGIGLNPLVQAASPLLLLAGQLRGVAHAHGRRRAAPPRARRDPPVRRAARARPAFGTRSCSPRATSLCAALDEAVLSTPWGAQSEWSQHPLLVALHREAWGGEKFFEMLDRIVADPARHIDLMELQYLVPRVRLRRQVPGARARARAAGRCAARPLSQDPRPSRRRPSPSCRCDGVASRIGGTA